jgi:hypothetical protein
MSLHVIERPSGWGGFDILGPGDDPFDPYAIDFWSRPLRVGPVDPNAHDGEWPAFITLAHEHVEWDGRDVPLFEGDVERREWEARRRR